MKKIAVVAILYLLFCAGCQGILEHSEREKFDNEKTLQVARNTLSVRQTQIAVAVGYFGRESITEENNKLIEEFMTIAARARDPNTLSDYELAYSLGLGLKLYENMLRQCWLDISGYWR